MCKRIFGKDVAPLLGESKLKTQYELYTEIVKKLKKANSTKKYMAGRLLKPVILQMYLENTLYKEVKADVIQLAEEDWLWARADAVVENEEGVQIVVRCLNTTSWFRGTWDAEEYGMPIDYYYEAQVNMYALNCRCADIAVLKDGYDFEIIRLKYEPNIIKVLGNAYMKFLEHIEDDVFFLKSIKALITKGGYLYLTVPSYDLLWSDEDILAGHHRRYSLKNISRKVESAGYHIEFSTYFFCVLPIPVFIKRTIPYRMGIKPVKNDDISCNHIIKNGVIKNILNFFLRKEIKCLKNKRVMKFGGSCLVVARRP